MKSPMLLAASVAAACLAGCTTVEDARHRPAFPLIVRNLVSSGGEAAPLASAIKREALSTQAFKGVTEAAPDTVIVNVDAVRPSTLNDGTAGFTYLVTWQRDGVQIGRQEDDCAADEIRACGRDIAETMYAQVYYFDRRVRS